MEVTAGQANTDSPPRQRARDSFLRALGYYGVPLNLEAPLSPEERVHVLGEVTNGDLLEAEGMFPLVLMASAYVGLGRLLPDEKVMPEPLPQLLGMRPDELYDLCSARGLAEDAGRRMVDWSEWARSEERGVLEEFFRRRLQNHDS